MTHRVWRASGAGGQKRYDSGDHDGVQAFPPICFTGSWESVTVLAALRSRLAADRPGSRPLLSGKPRFLGRQLPVLKPSPKPRYARLAPRWTLVEGTPGCSHDLGVLSLDAVREQLPNIYTS